MSSVKISLQFGGGAELLFDKIKKREIELPPLQKYLEQSESVQKLIEHQTESSVNETNTQKWTIGVLLQWLKENLLREREELFLQGATVRPGILVLVNDADWELLGELKYEIQDGDTVLFISTLHGG